MKATAGPATVAYEVVEVPVQADDIAPPAVDVDIDVDAVVQVPSLRPAVHVEMPVHNIVVHGLAVT